MRKTRHMLSGFAPIADHARRGVLQADICSAANDLQASSARTSSVERISMPSFAVLQTNARTDPLFDLDQG